MGNNHNTYQFTVTAQGVSDEGSCHGKNRKVDSKHGGGCSQRVSAYIMDSGSGRKLRSADAALQHIDVMIRSVDKGADDYCTHEWCWYHEHIYAYFRVKNTLHDCEYWYEWEDNAEEGAKMCLSDGKQSATVVPQPGAGDWVPFEADPEFSDTQADYFAANKVNIDAAADALPRPIVYDAATKTNADTWIPVGWAEVDEMLTFDLSFQQHGLGPMRVTLAPSKWMDSNHEQLPNMPRAYQGKAFVTHGNAGMWDGWRASYIDIMVRNDLQDKRRCRDSNRGWYVYIVIRKGFLRDDTFSGDADRSDMLTIRPQTVRSSLMAGPDPHLDADDCNLDCDGKTGNCKELYWKVTKFDTTGSVSSIKHLSKDRTDEEWILLGFTEETATLTVDVGIDGYSGGDGFRFVIAVDGAHYNDGKKGNARGVTVFMYAGADKYFYSEKKAAVDVLYRTDSWKGTFFYLRLQPDFLPCNQNDAAQKAECLKGYNLLKVSVSAPSTMGLAHTEDAELRGDMEKYAEEYNVAHKIDVGKEVASSKLGTPTGDDPDAGKSEAAAAEDCKDVLLLNSKAEDGYYWVQAPTGGMKGRTMKVFCDMTSFEGGWMLVQQGMGGEHNGAWYSSNNDWEFDAADSPNTLEQNLNAQYHKSWKMGDERINSFKYKTIRFSGGYKSWGGWGDDAYLKNSFFFVGCTYRHKLASSEDGKCNRSCKDPDCNEVIQQGLMGGVHSHHTGVGDWTLDSQYLHSCHDDHAYCIRKVGKASDGPSGSISCCGRKGSDECNIQLWIR